MLLLRLHVHFTIISSIAEEREPSGERLPTFIMSGTETREVKGKW